MSVDLDVDAVSGASSVGFDFFEDKEESQSVHFHGSIFVPPHYPAQFCNHSTLNFQNRESLKANIAVNERLHHNAITKGNKAGGSTSKDSDGNESTDAYYEHKKNEEDGSGTTFGIEIERNKDSQGNTDWKGTVYYEKEF